MNTSQALWMLMRDTALVISSVLLTRNQLKKRVWWWQFPCSATAGEEMCGEKVNVVEGCRY